MKNVNLILCVLIFCFVSCRNSSHKTIDCKNYLEGRFKFKNDKNNETVIYIKNGVHTEINKDVSKTVSKLVWTGECSYYLKIIETKGLKYATVGDSMLVKVIRIRNDEIEYQANFKGIELAQTLVKLN